MTRGTLIALVALAAATPVFAQLPVSLPEWVRMGHAWNGPNTCIPGQTIAGKTIERGGDPNEVLFGRRFPGRDSAAMAPLWGKVRQCIGPVPGLPDKSGALIAVEAGGVITKLIYGLGGKEGAEVLRTWYAGMQKAHGPADQYPDSVRAWTTDTLVYEILPASDFWFGAVTVHIRSLSGCRWLVREAARIQRPGDRPVSCW
ncbi:MAG: hypothetical protein EXR93_07240 [Gemmatimonadetes bacterium]|nr:hypothetical protein [Gemmatimonadota bacterium]